MRKHWIGACLLLAGAMGGPAANRASAQPWDATGISGTESRQTPLPLGQSRPESGGIYTFYEFLFMHQSRAMGHQIVAARGFRDSDGTVSGNPGQFVGSRRIALDTDSWGRTSWVPGFRLGVGYRMEDGWTFSIAYTHLFDAKYNSAAGPVPADFNPGALLEDTYLYSPVFNFSPFFAGPPNKIALGSGSTPYGIWNGAQEMVITYTQRFDNWDITARMPVYDTEYAHTYATAGGRFSWIWERFGWLTIDRDVSGNGTTQDAALYTNIMSQRMYGPFLGFGNDIYLGNAFALSGEVSAAALYSIVKERAKYDRYDFAVESKRSRMEYTIVPNINAEVNLWWYPIQGVSLRAGYQLWSYFNTIYMQQPIGFNVGEIDPSYKHRAVRIFHGFNVGVSINF